MLPPEQHLFGRTRVPVGIDGGSLVTAVSVEVNSRSEPDLHRISALRKWREDIASGKRGWGGLGRVHDTQEGQGCKSYILHDYEDSAGT